ncbi:Rieske [2Fe-2S] domain/Rieske-like [2Fe-2S] domain containing protein [Lotmaria passim]
MSNSASQPERVFVGKRSQFTEGSRHLVKCGVRNIAVVCYKGQLYAIDNACYHHGGPLLRGDIEEMGGHPCIVCPWHSYKIALDTGEGLYLGITINPQGGPPQQAVKSKGCKQRVHKVTVDDAGDVYVTVDLSGPRWESDTYASMELANREQATAVPMEGNGPGPRVPCMHSNVALGLRSGHVFQQMRIASSKSSVTGPGGTTSFDAGQKTRPSACPTPLGNRIQSCRTTNVDVPNLFVSCTSVTDVCAGVKEFYFTHHSGPLLRHAELGQHIELELPIKETRTGGSEGGRTSSTAASSSAASLTGFTGVNGEAEHKMRRRWTVCDVNSNGSLFTIMVKATGTDPERSGSAWLHRFSLHTPLRVCGIGGTFTFADHHDTIRQVCGNVLWITAGIGITSAFAAMMSTLNDTFFAEGKEALHVVHLHANHTLDTVAKLNEFMRWQRRFPLTEATRNSSSAKTYVMELFISLTKDSKGGETEKQQGSTSPLPPSLPATPVTHRHRLHKEDVVRAVQTYFGADLPLAYVCGPASFVSDCTDALLSAGLPEAHILTDDV